jgi:hypothetical protein
MKAKSWLILLALFAVAGWAVWYYFIREKTPGEQIDGALRSVERSVNEGLRKITP